MLSKLWLKGYNCYNWQKDVMNIKLLYKETASMI